MRWLVAGLVMVLTGCGGGAVAQPPRPARTLATAAAAPISVPRDADEKRAMFAQAQADLRAGDFTTARRRFEVLQPVYPELNDYVLAGLARSAARAGDSAAAEAAWSTLIVREPRSLLVPQAQLERGRLLMTRDDPGAAGALMAAAATDDVDVRAAAALALGQWAMRSNSVESAAVQFETARRLRAGSPPGREAKAQLLAIRARHPELAPRGPGLNAELELLLREQDYPAALATADAILATGSDPRVLRARADAQRGAGDFDGGIATLRIIVERYPQSDAAAETQLRIATLLWNRDRNDEAEAAFRAYLARYPRSSGGPEAMYALGRIAQGAGRNEEAVAAYRRLIAAAPSARQAREARWRIGWIAYQQGRWAEAAEAFGASAQGAGPADAPDAHYWRARALERGGDRDAAARGYHTLLDAAPASYYAYWAEERLNGAPALRKVTVAPPLPRTIGEAPPGADVYHWQRARELQAAASLGAARREMQAVERSSGDAPAVAAALPAAYQAAGGYRDAIRLAGARGLAMPSVVYPLAFWPQVSRAGAADGVDPLLAIALMRQESLFDSAARSPADARGLMQLLPSTAAQVAQERGQPSPADHLYDPEVNISLGVAHLADLMRRYNGDSLKATAAYNGGVDAVTRWEQRFGSLPPDEFVESITYRETRDYVKKVMGNYRRYQQLYGE